MGRLPLPSAGTRWPAPRTSGVGRPASACSLVRKGARWVDPFPRGRVSRNVPAALAAAAALQAVVAERDEVNARQFALVDRIRAAVAEIPDIEVVGDPVDRLPHLVTFSCLYVDGEALVTELDKRGFGVASGSACTASTLDAQPRARGDGRAHPRQRPGLADPRHDRGGGRRASSPCCPRWSGRSAREVGL